MARGRFTLCLACTLFVLSPSAFANGPMMVAQLDCGEGQRLYEQAHEATSANEFERALLILEQLKSSVPRQCRESDEILDGYEANIRSKIVQQRAAGPQRPCRPVQTGPTSYICQ